MSNTGLRITYIGGPTALLELGGLRLLTDPTFDPAGGEYRAAAYTLHKTQDPAIGRKAIGSVDAVLLSHDHHFDNLDHSGRDFLKSAAVVLTTQAGAERLGSGATGMDHWQTIDLPTADGRVLAVTATPARHGPANGDRGPVIGFALAYADQTDSVIYVSGDSVWYQGIAEVSRRYAVRVALLFMGAARVPEVGPAHLTFTAREAIEAARALADATIVPLHYEGWAHFSESRSQIDEEFETAGLADRLRWLEPGVAMEFSLSSGLDD